MALRLYVIGRWRTERCVIGCWSDGVGWAAVRDWLSGGTKGGRLSWSAGLCRYPTPAKQCREKKCWMSQSPGGEAPDHTHRRGTTGLSTAARFFFHQPRCLIQRGYAQDCSIISPVSCVFTFAVSRFSDAKAKRQRRPWQLVHGYTTGQQLRSKAVPQKDRRCFWSRRFGNSDGETLQEVRLTADVTHVAIMFSCFISVFTSVNLWKAYSKLSFGFSACAHPVLKTIYPYNYFY